jgi:Tfp pilus assembly protein PilP
MMTPTLLLLSTMLLESAQAKPGQAPVPPAPAASAAPTPASAKPAEQTPAPAPGKTAEQPGPAVASYNPEGRRDPFVSLLGRGQDPHKSGERAAGVPGLLISEVTVKGIVRDRSGFIAMIQAPDNKTYIVRPGDKLMDGSVKNITQDGVIFSQDVNDPLSLVKQREVPKRVRATEGRG